MGYTMKRGNSGVKFKELGSSPNKSWLLGALGRLNWGRSFGAGGGFNPQDHGAKESAPGSDMAPLRKNEKDIK